MSDFVGLALGPPDAEQDIGIGNAAAPVRDLGAGCGIGVIGDEGACSGAGFDGDLEALLDESLDRIGGRRDAALARMSFG